MPWCGPTEMRPYPTLGALVGQWIESHCVIPDGHRVGEPMRLTAEMRQFLFRYYRLYPDARPWPAPFHLLYTGGQLRRSQKWGKDPFAAAIIWAQALGPTTFAGWDAKGEPVGVPYPTPLIACLGTSQDQTDNTWRPLLSMARRGPLVDHPGVREILEGKVELTDGGRIEPVTTSARARLGEPMTFVSITESHLFSLHGGHRKVCGAVKRNVAGMDGRWIELTNAWDPTEGSEAQVTGTTEDPRVYVDTIEPHRVESLEDDEELYAELLRQYGDSAREKGGWVNIRGRIMDEVRSTRHTESDRRRFFLNEIVVGESTFCDPLRWDRLAMPEVLQANESIALGFDGSKYRDATALVACRLSDGKLFELKVWEKGPNDGDDWKVPSAEVNEAVKNAFAGYRVAVMFADPFRWQDYLDAWAALYPGRVVEFPTNQEQRMDKAIERFTTAFVDPKDTFAHDGSESLARHIKNTVLVKGNRKKPRPGEEDELETYYMKMAKQGPLRLIDLAVAAVLAYEARAYAIEKGLEQEQIEAWGFYS